MTRRSLIYRLFLGGATLFFAIANVVLLFVRNRRPVIAEKLLPRRPHRLPDPAPSPAPSTVDLDICSISFSLVGTYLASGSAYDQLSIWDSVSQQRISTWSGPMAGGFSDIDLSGDSSWLATISPTVPEQCVKFWTPGKTKETGEVTFKEITYNEFSSHPTCVAFSSPASDSATNSPTLVAVALADYSIKILKYDPHKRALPEDVLALPTNDPRAVKVAGLFRELVPLRGHTAQVNALSFSPDGKFLASASDDHTIRIWDAKTWHQVTTLHGHTGGVNSVSYSRKNNRLASASSDCTIVIWDMHTRARQVALRGHSDAVVNAVFCGGTDWLASTSVDRSIMLWSLEKGIGKAFRLAENPGNYAAIDVSADGQNLASSWGKEVRFWKTAQIQSEAKRELGAV